MDRMIYVGMSGAKQAMEQQASVANNMANVSTPGFRAQINNFRAVPVVGDEAATRAMVVATTPGADMRAGPLMQTGRALDVAIRGEGWLTVQMPDGSEAYTRVGNLQVGADGQLMTMDARPLVGDAGPLVVPPGSSLVVADDGIVTALGAGDPAVGAAEVGRLKLVNPLATELVRGDDGLFRMQPGAAAPQADPQVRLLAGAIEGSNVNPVEVMVSMIANARRFEMQMKTLQTAESNDQQANKLLSSS
ncbi:MAG: flagellar basal body rod protein FlgF [Polaromonas sp.]|jgi:flagellar basal-body rod protein FlgF|uniref:flagellar basal body rod protein FlgF n=1 Tax=Polaromonas sp. TaxID=1869339 RepID=UPI0027305DA9|nr:flagellar basal body rod protein FlgF [Polaromonas sp.]MDP2255274.1 flagellar basal body rod protein FlgF [Polaromonas sp.]